MSNPSVHLIVGDDEYRVAQHAKALVERLVPEADRALSLEVFDGRVDTVDGAVAVIRQATEAVQTQSFLGGAKTVWVKDISFLGGQRLGDAQGLKPSVDYLRSVIQKGIPAGHTLVLSGSQVALNSGVALDVGKLAKAGKAVLEEFDAPTRWNATREAAGWLAEESARSGRKLSPALCEELVARVGTDPRTLASELEKLLVYAGGNAPTSEDIAAVATPARTSEVWDLQDAFGERKLRQAVAVLRRLFDAGISPILMVIQLQSRVNELLLVRDVQDRRQGGGEGRSFQWGRGLPEASTAAIAALGKRWDPAQKSGFAMGKILAQSRNFKRIELRRARHLLMAAHERMVSASVPPEAVLELAVVDALAPV